MTMPDKIWFADRYEDARNIMKSPPLADINPQQAYIRADIVDELLMTLEWYNDGRDPVVSEVISRINAIMEGK